MSGMGLAEYVYAGLAFSPSVSLQAWDLVSLCNGVLVGFVAITACAHVVEPWAAIIIGAIDGLVSGLLCLEDW
jgi:ammonia channel protein AmtB